MVVNATSVEEITKSFCYMVLLQIMGQPKYECIYKIHKLMMKNAATISTTSRGGAHGHLRLILTGQCYMQLMGVILCHQQILDQSLCNQEPSWAWKISRVYA
eukprot:1923662-Ditylum_brightwellii.AAC.1